MIDDRFCWDDGNRWKIEERFEIEEVQEVFDDEYHISLPAHRGMYRGQVERRSIIIGLSASNRLLFVTYTWRGDQIRVISARSADTKEQRMYWSRRSAL